MMMYVCELKPATAHYKASGCVYREDTKILYLPRFLGEDEAEQRLQGDAYMPVVYVTNKRGYIPVRFRNNGFIVLKNSELRGVYR